MAEVSEFIHDNSAVVEVFIEARGNVCHRVYGVISHSHVDGEKWPGLSCFLSPLLCVMLILLSWTNWYRKRALMCFIAGNAWLVACGPVGRQHKVLHGQLGQTLCYRLGIKKKLLWKWNEVWEEKKGCMGSIDQTDQMDQTIFDGDAGRKCTYCLNTFKLHNLCIFKMKMWY